MAVILCDKVEQEILKFRKVWLNSIFGFQEINFQPFHDPRADDKKKDRWTRRKTDLDTLQMQTDTATSTAAAKEVIPSLLLPN